MKRILVLSGKGGTGKTTITNALIKLSNSKGIADCDVDAPNLNLSLKENYITTTDDFYGMKKAVIDYKKCINCNKCFNNCRFDAISIKDKIIIDQDACEGCSVCEYVCPANAIRMKDFKQGEIYLNVSEHQVFANSHLNVGSGTTGLLVSSVKDKLFNNLILGTNLVIIDGSPGIGCPVIASIKGMDIILIVAEASNSGISDLKRIVETAKTFNVKIYVCINKAGFNLDLENKIENYCDNKEIIFLGKIPYDKLVSKAINDGKSIIDLNSLVSKAIIDIYIKLMKNIGGNNYENSISM